MKQTNTVRAHLTGATTTTNDNRKGKISSFAIGERERARIERWRGQIAKRLDEIADCPAYIPATWLEEIERRPMLDVLTDMLIADRLTGGNKPSANKIAAVAYHRDCDDYEEGRGTRARNNHERQLADLLVLEAMMKSDHVLGKRQREFVRRFYRAGDRGLHNAEDRAIADAMDLESDLEEMDKPIPKRVLDAVKKITAKQ